MGSGHWLLDFDLEQFMGHWVIHADGLILRELSDDSGLALEERLTLFRREFERARQGTSSWGLDVAAVAAYFKPGGRECCPR